MWRNGWHRANCGHGILRWHPRRPQSIRRVQTNQAAAPQNIPQPPLSAVLKHAFAASVPLIGFGFMDQIVMVTVRNASTFPNCHIVCLFSPQRATFSRLRSKS
eukprot:m.52619 g.52619  ORF g.52619 m.52619 type:complete len:103 (+) comp9115_c0_seq2:153-461(+)